MIDYQIKLSPVFISEPDRTTIGDKVVRNRYSLGKQEDIHIW